MLGIHGVILERAQAGVQNNVRELHPTPAQLEQQLPAERSSRRWCFGGARLVRIDRLVMRERDRFANI